MREDPCCLKRGSCANTYFTAKAFNNDLGEHVAPDSVILLAEPGNLTVVSRFLFAEAGRREPEDPQTFCRIFFVQFFEPGVLRCISALACNAHHQHHLPLIPGKIHSLSINPVHCEIQCCGHFYTPAGLLCAPANNASTTALKSLIGMSPWRVDIIIEV